MRLQTFYANRQSVDPPIVRMAVLFFVLPLLVAAVGFTATTGWASLQRIGRMLFVYPAADCNVLDERCESRLVHHVTSNRTRRRIDRSVQEVEYYRHQPSFQIEYQVSGTKYVAWTYDGFGNWFGDNAKNHILALYKRGDIKRCWYDPADPDKVVLTREIPLSEWTSLGLPHVALAIAGGLVWISWLLMLYRGKNRRPRLTKSDVTA